MKRDKSISTKVSEKELEVIDKDFEESGHAFKSDYYRMMLMDYHGFKSGFHTLFKERKNWNQERSNLLEVIKRKKDKIKMLKYAIGGLSAAIGSLIALLFV